MKMNRVLLAVLAIMLPVLALHGASTTPLHNAFMQDDLNANGHKITGLAAPTVSLDAVNKAYVDSVISGAGNGMVLSSGNLHFGQSAPYTLSTIPFAATTSTIGFDSGFTYDPGARLLSVGNVEMPIDEFTPTVQVALHGGSPSVFTLPLYVGTPVAGGQATTKTYVDGKFSPIGNSKLVRTDSSGNLAAATIGSGLSFDGTTLTATGSGGTVTSVGITLPSWLTVSGSPVTTSGNLAVTAAPGQTANLFLATPDGLTGAVTLRAIVAADVPSLDASKIGSGTMATARLGSGTANSTTFLGGDQAYRQVSDSQVSSSAAIAKSKISTSGAWAAADIPSTLNTTTFPNVIITPTALSYSATTDIDFDGNGFRTLSLTGDVTFTTSNKAAGKTVTVKILADSSTRNFTFPSWHFVGAAAPASIAASKTAVVTVTAFGTLDTDCVAAYAVEP